MTDERVSRTGCRQIGMYHNDIMYALPEGTRRELKRPLGRLVGGTDVGTAIESLKGHELIVVGDMSTMRFYEHSIIPELAIVDFKVGRKPIDPLRVTRSGVKVLKVKNPPGVITNSLWTAVECALRDEEKVRIEVNGEEDLATLPCVALASDGATVCYGQPGAGLVVIAMNDTIRRRVKSLLKTMEV